MIGYGQDLVLLLARICLAAVFLVSGVHKALYFEAARKEFRDAKIPFPDICLVLVIPFHLLASMSLITGYLARVSAVALALFMVLVTVWVHDFWNRTGPERLDVSRDTLANTAILGGLLLEAVVGPGAFVIG